MAACLNVPVDVIEPAGFVLSDRNFRRAGMDYLGQCDLTRHADWASFSAARAGRLILLTTRAQQNFTQFAFRPDDTLILGRESVGAPDHIHNAADARLLIPLAPGLRSLNVAIAAAMVLSEGLRQTGGFRHPSTGSR